MYKKVLVPLDGSELAECVIPHIEALGRASGAYVELITIVEPVEMPTRGKIALSDDDLKQINTEARKEAHAYLNQIIKRLLRSGITAHATVLSGKPAETLVDYIASNDIDILIMATHGRSGITKWFWGSIAEKVLRAVNIPVLLVKAGICDSDS
jgi:nucleotide-binding universal stress UspA family protein